MLENAYLRLGFDPKAGGVLAWLSDPKGPNVLDDEPLRGRQIQACLWEGYPGDSPQSAADPCYNTVNPTQAAGNWGRTYNPLLEWEVGDDYVKGMVEGYDYASLRSTCRGPYRMEKIGHRFPKTGWFLRFRYDLVGANVLFTGEWWHEDAQPRWTHSSTVVAYMDYRYCQRPLDNEDKRVWESHCSDRIEDSEIVGTLPELGLRYRFMGDAGQGYNILGARFADYASGRICGQVPPGEAREIRLSANSYYDKWVPSGERIKFNTLFRLEK